MDVNPDALLFTQGSINSTFKQPREKERIDDAVLGLLRGDIEASDFPQLNVVFHEGHLWSLDNRRLWVFKKAKVSASTVKEVHYSRSPRFHELVEHDTELKNKILRPGYWPRVQGRCRTNFASPVESRLNFPSRVVRYIRYPPALVVTIPVKGGHKYANSRFRDLIEHNTKLNNRISRQGYPPDVRGRCGKSIDSPEERHSRYPSAPAGKEAAGVSASNVKAVRYYNHPYSRELIDYNTEVKNRILRSGYWPRVRGLRRTNFGQSVESRTNFDSPVERDFGYPLDRIDVNPAPLAAVTPDEVPCRRHSSFWELIKNGMELKNGIVRSGYWPTVQGRCQMDFDSPHERYLRFPPAPIKEVPATVLAITVEEVLRQSSSLGTYSK